MLCQEDRQGKEHILKKLRNINWNDLPFKDIRNCLRALLFAQLSLARFSYDNSTSLQPASADHLGAAVMASLLVLAQVAYRSGLQTNDARRNRNGIHLFINSKNI